MEMSWNCKKVVGVLFIAGFLKFFKDSRLGGSTIFKQ
jgi:hypothetical protein